MKLETRLTFVLELTPGELNTISKALRLKLTEKDYGESLKLAEWLAEMKVGQVRGRLHEIGKLEENYREEFRDGRGDCNRK
jgi:hypothetical protein